MSTRRDSHSKQNSLSSRNKENVPSKIARPSLVKTKGKQEFVTDSFLEEDLTKSSIPTPHGAKRRIRVQHSPRHRSTRSDLPPLQTVKHQRSLTRTSPIHTNGLTTPPRSRHGSFESPVDVLSSPPAALLENYHRIDQEEDLAATEGEISDPEDEDRPISPIRPRSAATTPTMARAPARRRDDTSQSVFSDPTGISFAQQYSDPNLRAIMTPHFQEAAKDREALDRVWKSQKPIAFSKAGRILLNSEEVAQSVSSSPHFPPERIVAFSKANRIRLASDDLVLKAHQRTFSDVTDRVDNAGQFTNDNLRREALPHNPRVHREPYFPKVHGFPARDVTKTVDTETDFDRLVRRARSESPYVQRPQLKDQTIRSDASVQTTDIWAQQAADEPVKSIETDTPARRFSDTQQLHTSPDFSRKINFDFTGQSFQVSDSPPVRAKNTLQDYQRDREIRGIARQAVTTSRLNQLKERESQEKLRQTSKSPVSEAEKSENSQRLPPIGLHRTLSNGSENVRQTPDRSSSHELLQRLARGSSTTPRSTTPSDTPIDGDVLKGKADKEMKPPVQATPKVVGSWTDTILPDTIKTTKRQQSQYTQTPHVSAGGWIDTPAPGQRLEPLEEQTEEIPEGLIDGIAKDTASEQTIIAEKEGEMPQQPAESIIRKVLNEAKDKPEQAENDSLALGNTTIKSLEDLLDMDDTNLTNISRLGDTECLGRLTAKLDRIRKTIHEAQDGISKIQDQMSQPEPDPEERSPVLPEPEPIKTLFPLGLLTVSIPVPVLFHRRRPGERLPRLTPLGSILLALWLWYVVECTLAEAYSHPIYANKYTWPEEPEPEFPFVLPTMLWRWSRLEFVRPWVVDAIKLLFVAFFRTISMALGLTDGFASEAQGASIVQQQNMENGFGMMNDEFL